MRRASIAGLGLVLFLTACTSIETDVPETLTLITHDSFAASVSDETFAAFTEQWGIEVEVIAAGDAGLLVNQAILTKDNPLADVLFGVDDTFLSRALDEQIFVEFHSNHLSDVPVDLDVDDQVTPIDYGDVCINYDKEWFESANLPVPSKLEDLRSDPYAGLLTVEHPATSSPGLAFMLATIAEFGEDEWLDFWEGLRENDVNVAADWDTAYYGDFVRYGGASPMVVSYATSPPAEVIFATEPLEEAPTGVIEAGCYRQVEYAGVLAGRDYPTASGHLVDYMLSPEFQNTIPVTWFVFPANTDTIRPKEFVDYAVVPADPARLNPDVIAENRERWINEWIAVMEG